MGGSLLLAHPHPVQARPPPLRDPHPLLAPPSPVIPAPLPLVLLLDHRLPVDDPRGRHSLRGVRGRGGPCPALLLRLVRAQGEGRQLRLAVCRKQDVEVGSVFSDGELGPHHVRELPYDHGGKVPGGGGD